MSRIYSRVIFISLVFVFISKINSSAQTTKQIEGIVKDRETKEGLPGSVINQLNSTQGSVTDNFGKFKMQVVEKSKLVFSYVGYTNDTLEIDGKKEYEILLIPNHKLLDEVVVTGVSKAMLMRQNPVAVSMVTSQMIDRANESNIIDALAKNTPGLRTLKTGPNISKPFIRGLGFNRILTLYDGVRQEGQQWGGEHGLEVDDYNIERAEIVKGPASLVYGSDALAGVVSLFPYIPKESDGKISGRLLSEYQSNNGLIGNGFRISSGTTHWLWIVRGSYRMAKNYTDKVDGRVYNTGFQERNLSTMVGYKSSSGFTHFNLTLYDNLQGIPDGSRDSLTRKFTKQIYEGNQDDIKTRPIVSNAELNSYALSPLHQRIQNYRIYANNHYHVGIGDVNFLLAFTQNIRREYNHPTDPDQAGLFLRLNTLNYTVKYNSPEVAHIQTSVGVNGMVQNNKNEKATDFPIPDYNLTDLGAFVVSSWHGENWTVVGGARFDTRNFQSTNLYAGTDPKTGFAKQVCSPDTSGASLQFPATQKVFQGWSLSLGSTYKINDIFNLKVNLSRGYRAPSIAELSSNGLDVGAHIVYIGNDHFVPEFSWQEDIGLFSDFPEVSASLSLFNKNIANYIYLNQVVDAQGKPMTDAQGNKTFQYQQASAQLYGLEATFAWIPKNIKGFTFNNQLALCYGFNRNPIFDNTKTQGEYLPFIPPARWVSNINQVFTFKSKWFSAINFMAEMDFNAAQNRYQALYQTETRTPRYTLFNLLAGTTIRQSDKTNWQFQFQVNNALDAVYQSNMSRLKYFEYYVASPNGRYGIYGMGRNICAKIIYTF